MEAPRYHLGVGSRALCRLYAEPLTRLRTCGRCPCDSARPPVLSKPDIKYTCTRTNVLLYCLYGVAGHMLIWTYLENRISVLMNKYMGCVVMLLRASPSLRPSALLLPHALGGTVLSWILSLRSGARMLANGFIVTGSSWLGTASTLAATYLKRNGSRKVLWW